MLEDLERDEQVYSPSANGHVDLSHVVDEQVGGRLEDRPLVDPAVDDVRADDDRPEERPSSSADVAPLVAISSPAIRAATDR